LRSCEHCHSAPRVRVLALERREAPKSKSSSDPGRIKTRSECHDQQHTKAADPVDHPIEDFQARGVGPMRILEDHQHRVLPCQRFHLGNERFQRSLPAMPPGSDRAPDSVRLTLASRHSGAAENGTDLFQPERLSAQRPRIWGGRNDCARAGGPSARPKAWS
jgi:hypothetical protein